MSQETESFDTLLDGASLVFMQTFQSNEETLHPICSNILPERNGKKTRKSRMKLIYSAFQDFHEGTSELVWYKYFVAAEKNG